MDNTIKEKSTFDSKKYHSEYYKKNREKLRERNKNYYKKNKEDIKLYLKEYNSNNKEKRREDGRNYRIKSKDYQYRFTEDKATEDFVNKYKAQIEAKKEYRKNYYLKNKEKLKENSRNYQTTYRKLNKKKIKMKRDNIVDKIVWVDKGGSAELYLSLVLKHGVSDKEIGSNLYEYIRNNVDIVSATTLNSKRSVSWLVECKYAILKDENSPLTKHNNIKELRQLYDLLVDDKIYNKDIDSINDSECNNIGNI